MSRLLILSSNPRRDLNLDREISDLNNALQRLGMFEISLGLGVPAQKISELIAQHSPQIIHFCGHGAGDRGLVFQDEDGKEQLVSTEILARIFKTFASEINCTVLNACDTVPQAEAIVEYINYAIGMSQPILDKAAYHFSVGFYKGLGAEKSIEQAYEMGCIAIQIWSETNSQSTQSRQYRKLEYAGDIVEPASPSLKEYEKPVLLKKTSNPVQEVHSLSASPDRPQEFVEFVKQEIDRKEYKDWARDAYDNFGQFSSQNAVSLTKSEYEQRKVLLGKVKQFWIEGFLQPSLQGNAALSLDRKDRPDAIADLSQGIEALSVELDASYEKLRDTRIYGEMGQGRTLLILGSPGAGKTIALLQLAQRLIERSEQNLSIPMPVVFNLSSWAKDQKPIFDWLMDELREKYQVPKSLSEPWIKQQQLILLLDGLDEVKEEHRNDCVRTLNDFIGLFPQTEVAVCSRVRDYEALTERLQISSALCLQPLSSEQVYQFLDTVGGSLAGLKTLLKRDAELDQFAQTPLILNFMSVAYQGWSLEKLIPHLYSTTDRHKHLFDTYIDRRLERGAASEYSKEKVLHWLSWLADQMVQEKRTIFLIEKMQPTWLKNRGERKIYRIGTFLVSGLVFGLLVGLIFPMLITQKEIMEEPSYGQLIKTGNLKPLYGLTYGLIGVTIGGIIATLPKKVSPLERLSWSWQRFKSRLRRESFAGVGYALLFGLLLFVWVSPFYDVDRLFFALKGVLIFVLLFGLGSGLGSSEIEQQTVPNQGIRSSLRNCLIIGLISGLIGGLISGLINKADICRLIDGSILGLIFGLKYGGAACIQHFTLRQIICQKGRIPWNYAKFLDFAADRLLMKKVGGGYVFFHRMLLEHFARMSHN